MYCKNCGEEMSGDGYWVVIHCPYANLGFGYEPDANPVSCTGNVEEED